LSKIKGTDTVPFLLSTYQIVSEIGIITF